MRQLLEPCIVPVSTGCPGRRSHSFPLRVVRAAAELIRVHGNLPRNLPVVTLQCRKCQEIVTLTANDLGMASTQRVA